MEPTVFWWLLLETDFVAKNEDFRSLVTRSLMLHLTFLLTLRLESIESW